MICGKCGTTLVPIQTGEKALTVCPSCDTPDRLCTWCKIPMTKKLVGNGRYLHYLCPKCVFQHTSIYVPPSSLISPNS